MKVKFTSLIILTLLVFSFNAIKAQKIIIDYVNYENGEFIIGILEPNFPNDKVIKLEIYVNRTLYKVYHFYGNETYPLKVKIILGKLKGPTLISARAYLKISGWSLQEEILADSAGIKSKSINLSKDIALFIGILFIFLALMFYFKGKFSKGIGRRSFFFFFF